MSNRGLSAASISALQARSVEFYHLLRFDFSTPLYYTTAPYNITYNGNVYSSSAIISDVPEIREQLKISPTTINIEWSGVSLASQAVLLLNYRNVSVYIYRYLASTRDAFLMYKGFIDSYSSEDDLHNGKSDITWSVTNHWADWESQNGRLLTDQSQQAIFTGDLFLQYAGVTDPVLEWWGNTTSISYLQGSLVFVPINDWLSAPTGRYVESNFYWLYNWTSGASSEGRLPVFYGSSAGSGSVVFRDVTSVTNTYLWVVYALSEGECNSLTDILFNGVSYTHASLSPYLTATFYSGTDTQTVHAALDTDSSEWTTAHQGKGICYVVIRYTFNKDIWQGEPEPQFKISGKKCYDPRTGVTAASSNPIIILYDYLTNSRYGKGVTSGELDLPSFNSAADYCDQLLTDHNAGLGGTPVTIPRHTFNGVLAAEEEIKSNVESILSACNGAIVWINGKYTVVIERDNDVSVYSFTLDNITPKISVKDIGIKSRANKVFYKFVDPVIDYAESTVYAEMSAALIASEDNGKALTKTISNKYETNRYRAQNLANTELKRSRDGLTCTIESLLADAITIETGNVVDVTLPAKGWAAKKFRVISMGMPSNGDVNLNLMEYDYTNYQWGVSAEASTPTKQIHTNPLSVTAPTSLVLAAGTTEQLTKADGTAVNRIKVSWTASADVFSVGYEVQYKLSTDTNYTEIARSTSNTEVVAWIEGITSGVQYDVRVRAYNGIGVVSAWLSGNVNGTGVLAIGYGASLAGAVDFNSSTYVYYTTFDAAEPANYEYATFNNGVALVGDGAPVGSSAFIRKGATVSMAGTLTFSAYNWKMKSAFAITSGYGQYMKSAAGDPTSGVLCGAGFADTGFGVGFKWNTGTSQIDVYAMSRNSGSLSSTLITSIADTGVFIIVTAEWSYNTSVLVTLNIGGTLYTATVTTSKPNGNPIYAMYILASPKDAVTTCPRISAYEYIAVGMLPP